MSEKDSRERLEADAKRYIKYAADYSYEDVLWAGETFTLYDAIIELLDRQAAITESECSVKFKGRLESCRKERELYRDTTSALMGSITEGLNRVSAIIDRYDEGLA